MTSQTTATQENYNERTTGLGGHDIGAICGVHPFLTAFDVYNEKVNGVTHFDPQYIQKRGLSLEQFLLDEYIEQQGSPAGKGMGLVVGGFYRHQAYPFFYAHVDATLQKFEVKASMNGGCEIVPKWVPCQPPEIIKIIECKCPAVIGKEWGEEGTFEVPDYIKCQAAWYCMVIDCDVLDIIVDSPFKLKVYTYNRDEELEEQLVSAGLAFWNNHILAKVPPEPKTANDVRELYSRSDPDATMEADSELCSMLYRIKKLQGHIKSIEKEIEELKVGVQIKMRNNETIHFCGVPLATWKSCTVTRLDTKALKDEQPDIYDDYMVATTSRRFLVK